MKSIVDRGRMFLGGKFSFSEFSVGWLASNNKGDRATVVLKCTSDASGYTSIRALAGYLRNNNKLLFPWTSRNAGVETPWIENFVSLFPSLDSRRAGTFVRAKGGIINGRQENNAPRPGFAVEPSTKNIFRRTVCVTPISIAVDKKKIPRKVWNWRKIRFSMIRVTFLNYDFLLSSLSMWQKQEKRTRNRYF